MQMSRSGCLVMAMLGSAGLFAELSLRAESVFEGKSPGAVARLLSEIAKGSLSGPRLDDLAQACEVEQTAPRECRERFVLVLTDFSKESAEAREMVLSAVGQREAAPALRLARVRLDAPAGHNAATGETRLMAGYRKLAGALPEPRVGDRGRDRMDVFQAKVALSLERSQEGRGLAIETVLGWQAAFQCGDLEGRAIQLLCERVGLWDVQRIGFRMILSRIDDCRGEPASIQVFSKLDRSVVIALAQRYAVSGDRYVAKRLALVERWAGTTVGKWAAWAMIEGYLGEKVMAAPVDIREVERR